MVKIKMLQIPKLLQRAAGHEIMPQVPEVQAAGSVPESSQSQAGMASSLSGCSGLRGLVSPWQ